MDNNFYIKNIKNFVCEKCDFKCSKKGDWKRHLLTTKHKCDNVTDVNDNNHNTNFCCSCGRQYRHKSGLSRHKRCCEQIINKKEKEEIQELVVHKPEQDVVYNYVKQLVESNENLLKHQIEKDNNSHEFQLQMFQQMMEFMKQQCSTTNNINNGQIQNNNHFNLQIYLNETCKNAMTINQFLDYLEPTVEELEATAHLGYVEGISRIIMRGFKNLEEYELPFHCTDLKREHIYLKNPDEEWVEEKDEKPLLLRFIKEVAKKSFKNLSAWQKKNPNWANYNSKQNDLFNKIVGNSVSGATEEEQQANYEKIMKNIMKNIVIDKSKKNK